MGIPFTTSGLATEVCSATNRNREVLTRGRDLARHVPPPGELRRAVHLELVQQRGHGAALAVGVPVQVAGLGDGGIPYCILECIGWLDDGTHCVRAFYYEVVTSSLHLSCPPYTHLGAQSLSPNEPANGKCNRVLTHHL